MKMFFLIASCVWLFMAWGTWEFGVTSPTTGPYWTFYAATSGVAAILYAGTKEK